VRFGYDLSYRVRALEAASATTQRTENPIRRLFVFLDPRAQKGIVLSGARRGGDCSAPLRGPPRRGSSASPPRRFGGSLLRHSLMSAGTFLRWVICVYGSVDLRFDCIFDVFVVRFHGG
jgi:hypothetical protein